MHPDGMIVGTGGADGSVKIWDIRRQSELHSFEEHSGPVSTLSFSENGVHLASGSADGVVKVCRPAVLVVGWRD